jgi:hypothetical protein
LAKSLIVAAIKLELSQLPHASHGMPFNGLLVVSEWMLVVDLPRINVGAWIALSNERQGFPPRYLLMLV